MAQRSIVSVGVLTALTVVLLLATVPVAGQAPSSSAKTTGTAAKRLYTPPRTPDGQPDLQGFWTNSTYTPLERPKNVTKELYSPEEAARAEREAAEREAEQTVPGTVADVHYDLSQFGLDRSQATHSRNLRTGLIVDPPEGRLPPVTAEGQKRAADVAAARKRMGDPLDAAENMNLGERCIMMANTGPMLPMGYMSTYQIVQGPGYVMILAERMHDFRIIPLDGRPHLPSNVRQWKGDSRGRWDGNTLIVETTNYNSKRPGVGDNTAAGQAFRGASEDMRLTEWFTRVDADTIQYRFTVEDPKTWARPWTAEIPILKDQIQGPLFEHACHEGNYSMTNMLRGAREAEKKAAEPAAKKVSK
jgi:hypothetical protein